MHQAVPAQLRPREAQVHPQPAQRAQQLRRARVGEEAQLRAVEPQRRRVRDDGEAGVQEQRGRAREERPVHDGQDGELGQRGVEWVPRRCELG